MKSEAAVVETFGKRAAVVELPPALEGLRDDLGSFGVAALLADLEADAAVRARARLEASPARTGEQLAAALRRLASVDGPPAARTAAGRAWALDLLIPVRAAHGALVTVALLAGLEERDAARQSDPMLRRAAAGRRAAALRAFVSQAARADAVGNAPPVLRDDPDRQAWLGHRPRSRSAR